MAISFIGTSGFQSGAGALSFAVPTGTAAGDLLLAFTSSANQVSSLYPQIDGSGSKTFSLIDPSNSYIGTGTAGAAGAIDLQVSYYWYDSGTNVTLADSGSYQAMVVVALRGVDTTTPFALCSKRVDSTATTTTTFPMTTAPASGDWIVHSIGLDRDATSNPYTLWSGGSWTGVQVNLMTGNNSSVSAGATTNAGAGGGLYAHAWNSAYGGGPSAFQDSTTHAYVSFHLKQVIPLVPVTSTRATTWNVAALEQVTATRATTWKLDGRVTQTKATTWNFLAQSTQTKATTWTAFFQTTQSKATTWAALFQSTQSKATTWKLDGQVTQSKASTWRVLFASTQTKATTWTTRFRLTEQKATSWSQQEQVTTSTAAWWHTRQLPGPPVHTITTDFTSPAWIVQSGATGTSTRLTIPADDYTGADTPDLYDLRDSRVFCKITGWTPAPGYEFWFQLSWAGRFVSWWLDEEGNQNALTIWPPLATVSWDSAKPWLSIRESGGTTYFERSATGAAGSWELVGSQASLTNIDTLGFSVSGQSATDVWVENVNTSPVTAVRTTSWATLKTIVQGTAPRAAWGFESAPPFVDATGNGYSAALTGDGAWYVPGKALYNPYEPAAGSGATVPRGGLTPTTALTLSCHFSNNDDRDLYLVIMSKSRTGASDSYALYDSYQGDPRKPNITITTTTGTYVAAAPTAKPDFWDGYLAGTYDGANLKLYIDGELVATTAATGTIVYDLTSVTLLTSAAYPGESVGGQLDDVRIYDVALTAAEINELMYLPVTDTVATFSSTRRTSWHVRPLPGPPVHTITTDFTSAVWDLTSGAATGTTTRLTIPGGNEYGEAYTPERFNLDESRWFLKVAQAPTGGSGSELWMELGDVTISSYYGWFLNGAGDLEVMDWSTSTTVAWDSAKPWLSIRETGGTVHFERSATGQPGTWESVWTVAAAPYIDSLQAIIYGQGDTEVRVEYVNASQVTATRATTWDVAEATLAQVTASRASTWDVIVQVTSSLPTTWHVLVPVAAAATCTTSWIVRSTTTGQRPTLWHILTPASASRDTTWAQFEQVTATKATTWDAAFVVALSIRPTTWNVLSRVTAERSTSWAAAFVVALATRGSTWDVLMAVSAVRSTSWAALGAQGATRDSTWHVLVSVLAERATVWDVDSLATQVTASRATSWSLEGRLSSTRDTTWTLRAYATQTRPTNWAVLAQRTETKASTWNVGYAPLAVRGTTWTVQALISGSRASTWTVTTAVAVASSSTSWAVLVSAGTSSRETTWSLAALVTATGETTWSLAATVVAERFASWATLALASGTRGTLWMLAAHTTELRSSTWAVHQTTTITMVCATSWAVLVSTTGLRSSTWHVFYGLVPNNFQNTHLLLDPLVVVHVSVEQEASPHIHMDPRERNYPQLDPVARWHVQPDEVPKRHVQPEDPERRYVSGLHFGP